MWARRRLTQGGYQTRTEPLPHLHKCFSSFNRPLRLSIHSSVEKQSQPIRVLPAHTWTLYIAHMQGNKHGVVKMSAINCGLFCPLKKKKKSSPHLISAEVVSEAAPSFLWLPGHPVCSSSPPAGECWPLKVFQFIFFKISIYIYIFLHIYFKVQLHGLTITSIWSDRVWLLILSTWARSGTTWSQRRTTRAALFVLGHMHVIKKWSAMSYFTVIAPKTLPFSPKNHNNLIFCRNWMCKISNFSLC